MGFGALRSIIRPVTRALSSSTTRTAFASHSPLLGFRLPPSPLRRNLPWIPPSSASFYSLSETRSPKRRPSLTCRRKRSFLKSTGPYRWVKPVDPDLAPPKNPNEGSVKGRNRRKRMKLKQEFIRSERKKRLAERQEANRKKVAKYVERKMAAVARDRAWAERLKELQRLEEEKKKGAIV